MAGEHFTDESLCFRSDERGGLKPPTAECCQVLCGLTSPPLYPALLTDFCFRFLGRSDDSLGDDGTTCVVSSTVDVSCVFGLIDITIEEDEETLSGVTLRGVTSFGVTLRGVTVIDEEAESSESGEITLLKMKDSGSF